MQQLTEKENLKRNTENKTQYLFDPGIWQIYVSTAQRAMTWKDILR